MPEKIIEEEQLDLLGKMLLYSLDHMTGREREVYDSLVETLSQRVQRLRRLEHTAEKHRRGVTLKKPTGAAPVGNSDSPSSDNPKKLDVVKDKSPGEVVKSFIEAWNFQDFETEYFCLSTLFKKGGRNHLTVEDYLRNRQSKYHDRGYAAPLTKSVENISSAEIQGSRALVDCIEIHDEATDVIHLHREYTLIFEDQGWRILDFSTKHKSFKRKQSPRA